MALSRRSAQHTEVNTFLITSVAAGQHTLTSASAPARDPTYHTMIRDALQILRYTVQAARIDDIHLFQRHRRARAIVIVGRWGSSSAELVTWAQGSSATSTVDRHSTVRTSIVQVHDKEVRVGEVQLVARVAVALMCISVDDHHALHAAARGCAHAPDGKCDVRVRTPAQISCLILKILLHSCVGRGAVYVMRLDTSQA